MATPNEPDFIPMPEPDFVPMANPASAVQPAAPARSAAPTPPAPAAKAAPKAAPAAKGATPDFIPVQNPNAPMLTGQLVENAPPAPQTVAKPQDPNRGFMDTASDSYQRAANRGFTGWLARNAMLLTGINTPEEFDALPYADRKKILDKTAADIDKQYATIEKDDKGHWAKQLLGDVTGGFLGSVDPTLFVPGLGPTASVGKRVLQAMGWSGVGDLLEQNIDKNAGIRDELSLRDTAISMGMGGTFELPFALLAKKFGPKRVEAATDGTPIVREENPDGSTTIYTDPESGVVVNQDGSQTVFGNNQRGSQWNAERDGIVVEGDPNVFYNGPSPEQLAAAEADLGPLDGPKDVVENPNAKVDYGMMTPEEEQAFAEASFAVRDKMTGVPNPNMNEGDFLDRVGLELADMGLDPDIVKKSPYVPGKEAVPGVTPRLVNDNELDINNPANQENLAEFRRQQQNNKFFDDEPILEPGDQPPHVNVYDPVTYGNPTPLPANANDTGPKSFEEAAADFQSARAKWDANHGGKTPAELIQERQAQTAGGGSGTGGGDNGTGGAGSGGGGNGSGPEPVDMPATFDKLRRELKTARKVRNEGDAARKAELSARAKEISSRRRRTAGEEGFNQELDALKGEYTKPDYESIKVKFSAPEIHSLFEHLKNDKRFTLFQSINARSGLRKMLEGEVPQPAELDLLRRSIPKDIVESLSALKEKKFTFLGATNEIANLSKALNSSLDFSAPFRQGVWFVGRPQFWKSMGAMFKAAGPEKNFDNIMDEIFTRPTYGLMDEAGLALTGTGHKQDAHEEAYMSTLASKIPGVNNSERAFTGYLNKLRADVFDDLLKQSQGLGVDFTANPQHLTQIADYVNAATGRGKLSGKSLQQAAPFLNGLLFSPRLMASRLKLMTQAADPRFYTKNMNPVVRQAYFQDLIKFGTIVSTVVSGLAAAGAEVESDPRSTNFGKPRIPISKDPKVNVARTLPAQLGVGVQSYDGETRYDVSGGFLPFIRLAAKLASNSTVTGSGKEKEFGTKSMTDETRGSTVAKFVRTKASPLASYIMDWAFEENIIGEPFDPAKDSLNLVTPLGVRDFYDAYHAGDPADPANNNNAATGGPDFVPVKK